MKRPLLAALILLLIMPFSHAAELKNWDIDISLSERTSQWTVALNYDENVEKSDYYILNDIFEVGTFADGKQINCKVSKRELGTSVLCDKINAQKIVYKFMQTLTAL